MYFLLLGNNRQQMSHMYSNDFFLDKEGFKFCKGMSPGTFQEAVVCTAFAAGVFLVSILQAGEWTRVSTQPDIFSTYITTMDQHQVSIQHAVLGLSEQSPCW